MWIFVKYSDGTWKSENARTKNTCKNKSATFAIMPMERCDNSCFLQHKNNDAVPKTVDFRIAK